MRLRALRQGYEDGRAGAVAPDVHYHAHDELGSAPPGAATVQPPPPPTYPGGGSGCSVVPAVLAALIGVLVGAAAWRAVS